MKIVMNEKSRLPFNFPSKPKVDPTPPAFSIPYSQSFVMDNGLEWIHMEDQQYPIVVIRVYIPAGNIYDFNDIPGLSMFLGDILTEGSNGLSSHDFAERLDRIGAQIVVHSDHDWLIVSGMVLKEKLYEFMELLSDVLFKPNFSEDEVIAQQQIIRSNIVSNRTRPDFLAHELMSMVLFKNHPYSFVFLNEKNLEQISEEKLHRFHQKHFRPNGSLIGISGQISTEETQALHQRYFKDWRLKDVPSVSIIDPLPLKGLEIHSLDRPFMDQTHIIIAQPSLKITDPDFLPFSLFNKILGSEVVGKLFAYLREELGYTYSINSTITYGLHGSNLAIQSSVKQNEVGNSIKAIQHIISEMKEGKITEEEVQNVKNMIQGSYLLSFDNPETPVHLMLQQKIFQLPGDFYQQYLNQLAKLTLPEIIEAGQRYFLPEQWAIILVGKSELYIDEASDFGMVHEYYLDQDAIHLL